MAKVQNHKISTLMLLNLRQVRELSAINFQQMSIHSITTSGQNYSKNIGSSSYSCSFTFNLVRIWFENLIKTFLKIQHLTNVKKEVVFTGKYRLLATPVLNCLYVLQIFTKLICIHFGFKNIVHLKNKIWLYWWVIQRHEHAFKITFKSKSFQ